MRKWVTNFYYSFPIQLLLLHLRSNLILIGIWIILALLISDNLASLFGAKYLFLSPEYLGEVNGWSFFILGFWFAGFLMAWNLTTYLLDAYRFPFLATLEKPFTKFSINNFIIPLSFFVFYLGHIVYFQGYFELKSFQEILLNLLSFIGGGVLLISVMSAYFQFTNKDIHNFVQKSNKPPPDLMRQLAPGRPRVNIETIRSGKTTWRVDTYLTTSLRPRIVRSISHYDKSLIYKIFKQNHLNVLVVQLASFLFLVLIGLLMDNPYMRFPAASNIFILGGMIVSIVGAITYWFGRWRLTVILLMLVGINYLSKFDLFNHENRAYGMNYETSLAKYDFENLANLSFPDYVEEDKLNTEEILHNWHEKQQEEKPKMIFLCVSGGGMKAATWATQVIQQVDKRLEGELFNHTFLVSGASGGMMGAAYMRELFYQKANGKHIDLYSPEYIDDISTDLLNSITFAIVANDLFMPWVSFESGGYTYYKDRGYIFEKQFNENTHQALDKTLLDYRLPEKEAIIPMMFLTPSIVNDGRRLLISPHGVSYMSQTPIGTAKMNTVLTDAIDFTRMFKDQDALNLRFTTALRMNATYPYVLPNVHLPSVPEVEVLDAGFRDNQGIMSATRFIHVFKDWILENTSGIILIQISSKDKFDDMTPLESQEGLVGSILNPLGIVSKILSLQDFEHDTNLGFIFDLLGPDNFDVVRFTYRPTEQNEEASMTYHLTTREKQDILDAFLLPENQRNLEHLMTVLHLPQ